jgi:4'-phosphopantetheinyl transferase
VHVWLAALRRPDLPDLAATLAPDERRRGDRFHRPDDRDRFVAAHGLLRLILGRYLDQPPASLRFGAGPHGKPALLPAADPAVDLRFNLAHAGDLALYAVAESREVGVDLEAVRAERDLDLLAATVLSPAERVGFAALPAAARPAAFFAAWTRKEAYVKALGVGLGRPFAALEVVPGSGGATMVRDPAAPPGEPAWTLRDLDPAPGYAAAVAAAGAGWCLRRWRWPEGRP